MGAQTLGFFLVESLGVILLLILDLLKGMCLAKHGPLSIIVGMALFFFGGEKKRYGSAWGSTITKLTIINPELAAISHHLGDDQRGPSNYWFS